MVIHIGTSSGDILWCHTYKFVIHMLQKFAHNIYQGWHHILLL
uniref:Uncharacterized protein n=1 Tax=Siphoviridae sp. ctxMM9 TaxID=2827973 RepID=A0A8S5T749_9CAUD|nr:MAG TPA: hypothetical protein [Siphoviridae sp. ctxMM9]